MTHFSQEYFVAALTFNGIIGGINLGLFTLGMFSPWINSKGALTGSIVSLLFVSWLGVNSQIAETEGYISEFDKPTFNPNCTDCPDFQPVPLESSTDVFILYKISYMWYSAIGLVMTMLVGLLVSWITGFHDPCRVDPDLLSPPMRNLYSSLFNDLKEQLKLPIETKEEIEISQTRQLYPNGKL